MKIANISNIKNKLSAYIDMVRHGETILICDRNQPVARLEPIRANQDVSEKQRLVNLERKGVIRPIASAGKRSNILSKVPPQAKNNASIVDALLTEREESR